MHDVDDGSRRVRPVTPPPPRGLPSPASRVDLSVTCRCPSWGTCQSRSASSRTPPRGGTSRRRSSSPRGPARRDPWQPGRARRRRGRIFPALVDDILSEVTEFLVVDVRLGARPRRRTLGDGSDDAVAVVKGHLDHLQLASRAAAAQFHTM